MLSFVTEFLSEHTLEKLFPLCLYKPKNIAQIKKLKVSFKTTLTTPYLHCSRDNLGDSQDQHKDRTKAFKRDVNCFDFHTHLKRIW